jgi:type IV pilus modification protein PilV
MSRRNRQAGFTMIEILIAMVILAVGIVGILAIFPVGILNTADATGDTIAANLAESVHASLVAAHRQVVVKAGVNGTNIAEAVLIHDLQPANDGPNRYKYTLPTEADSAKPNNYPCLHPDPAKFGGKAYFVLGADRWLLATSQNVRANSDPTDLYFGYGFKFFVRKVPTVPAGGNSGMYEYNIVVARVLGVGPSTGSTTSSTPPSGGGGKGGGGKGGGGGGGGGGGSLSSDGPPTSVADNDTSRRDIAVLTARISGP